MPTMEEEILLLRMRLSQLEFERRKTETSATESETQQEVTEVPTEQNHTHQTLVEAEPVARGIVGENQVHLERTTSSSLPPQPFRSESLPTFSHSPLITQIPSVTPRNSQQAIHQLPTYQQQYYYPPPQAEITSEAQYYPPPVQQQQRRRQQPQKPRQDSGYMSMTSTLVIPDCSPQSCAPPSSILSQQTTGEGLGFSKATLMRESFDPRSSPPPYFQSPGDVDLGIGGKDYFNKVNGGVVEHPPEGNPAGEQGVQKKKGWQWKKLMPAAADTKKTVEPDYGPPPAIPAAW